jgi:lysophospholipase L1-like esterase
VTVVLNNLGVSGWTSADLLSALKTLPTMQTAVAGAQVVTFEIGRNDYGNARDLYRRKSCGGTDNQDCLRQAATDFKLNWDGIVAEIRMLLGDHAGQTILRTMTFANAYAGSDTMQHSWLPEAPDDFHVFKPYLDDWNQYIVTTAAAAGIPVARVDQAFNGSASDEDPLQKGLISSDLWHPNEQGHQVTADLLQALGYAPLR